MVDLRDLNPLGNLFDALKLILDNSVIKYSGLAHDKETLESRQNGDGYLDAINKRDTFFSYNDYTETELREVGITSYKIIREALNGNTREIPKKYWNDLLLLRRQRCIDMFEEKNDYYRELNGYPPSTDTKYFYTPTDIATAFNINPNIPIHQVQDYYNKQEPGLGDYYISIIEHQGVITSLIERYPDKKYLKFIGSNRIPIQTARNGKNFQIIHFVNPSVQSTLINNFLDVYEQCREYFVTTIYNYNFRSFIERYDNFIAMCIMLMTIYQVSTKQLTNGIERNYFDIYAIRFLYEAYDLPYDLDIDEATQNNILRNINIMIQNKGTDKVIYDIAYLLGVSNLKYYKYYLGKERLFDEWGAPIVATTEQFNTDTGEYETVYDYEKMYDVYFQKFELRDTDLSQTFSNPVNHVNYKDAISKDPLWFDDQYVHDMLWQTEYNFVESKYFSIGVSYSMTEIIFENVLLLKMLLRKKEDFKDVMITLPKIMGTNTKIPLFDAIIALVCLTACKHNLFGEIISVPTQVVSVLDYLRNKEGADLNLDTLKFNYNYFFNPDPEDNNDEVMAMRDELIAFIQDQNNQQLANTFGFNFKYLDPADPETKDKDDLVKSIMTESDYEKFKEYTRKIMQNATSNTDKVEIINEMYTNIKSLKKLLNYYMSSVVTNRYKYESIKRMYDALFYSEEMRDLFTITGFTTGYQRTAYTYFEFLKYINPDLYNALFFIDLESEYKKYIYKHDIPSTQMTYDQFLQEIEYGTIFIDYSTLKGLDNIDNEYAKYKDEKVYSYINHIITRLKSIVDNVNFMYMVNDTNTPITDLLIKLIKFFKSYTVDMLSLDTLFVLDLRPENLMRLFDEVVYIKKDIAFSDDYHVAYSDALHSMRADADVGFDRSSHVYLNDKMVYNVFLYITNKIGYFKDHPEAVFLKDEVESNKDIDTFDKSGERFYDVLVKSSISIHPKDKTKMTDKIVRIWSE